jgi:hypothetical protein
LSDPSLTLRLTHDSGNFIIIVSTLLSLPWGGSQFGWATAKVLVPLILGLFGIFVWIIHEALVPNEPILPLRLFNNRTTISGWVIFPRSAAAA